MALSGIFIRSSMGVGIVAAEKELTLLLDEEVKQTAEEALDWAQQNAPWEDRTGDARDGLDFNIDWQGHAIVWTMFHTVPYGIYLETRWNGKYAIIMPTLEQFAPEIGRGLTEFGSGNYG